MSTASQQETSPLITWLKGRIEKLHSNPQQSDLHAQFDDLFSADAKIILNHVPSSPNDLFKELEGRNLASEGEEVEWKDIAEANVDDGSEAKEGATSHDELVAGCFIITRSLKFRIRAAPAQVKTHVTFSARVRKDRDGDSGKVTELFFTTIDKRVPIVFNVPNVSLAA